MKKKNNLKKVISYRDNLNIKKLVLKENNIKPFERNDFDKFLFKFYGNFIYRGKKSYSFKTYDYLLLQLKKKLKKNPIYVLMLIIKILMPFLILGKKSYRKRVFNIPILAKNKKKYNLIINWLIKQFKFRSNIQGVHKDDVLKILIDTFFLKGSAINLKKNNYLEILKVRKNLVTSNYYKLFNDLKKEEKKKKNIKLMDEFFEEAKMTKSQIIWYLYKKNKLSPNEKFFKKVYDKRKNLLKLKNGKKYFKNI